MKNIILLFILLSGVCWGQNFKPYKNSTYQPEAEKINKLVHTDLNVQLDFEKELLYGTAEITLQPHFYPTDSLSLDAQKMIIHEVALVNPIGKKKLNYSYNERKLNIQLDQKYNRNQTYKIFIKYTAQPNEIKGEGNQAISGEKGLYFINSKKQDPSKPIQAWTQGEPKSSSVWFPTIDEPNQKTTQKIAITVPDEFVTLSNGTMTDTKKNDNGTRTDTWIQKQKHAPYLFFMGVGDFAVIKDQWKGKPVNYYVELPYADVAKDIFGQTPVMISFFSEKFGYEFPWDKYSQMAVRDFISGAMENTTAVSHMEVVQQKRGALIDENIWEDVIVHELAHHWFGDLVTTESWANLTLNESFANYSEYLWREHAYGKDYADAHRWKDLSAYLLGDNFNKDLVRFHHENSGDMFDAVSYNKGGYILHMLRSFLGDEAFFEGLKNYLKNNEFSTAEAHMLRIELEKVSGKDLNWFFNQWFFGHGHPKLKVITENLDNQIKINLRQTQNSPLFTFPLAIDLFFNGEKERHYVWVKNQELNSFTFDVQRQPDLVIVNADYDIVAEIEEEKNMQQYAHQYLWAKDEYTSRFLALEQLGQTQNIDSLALKAIIAALDDPYFGLRIKAIEMLDVSNEGTKIKALEKLKYLAQYDDKTLVKAAALRALNQINDPVFIDIFNHSLKSPSYAVQSAALNYLMSHDRENAIQKARGLDNEVIVGSAELLEIFLPEWIEKKELSHQRSIAELAAIYQLIPYQKPKFSNVAQKAFDWIMTTDSHTATFRAAEIYKQYYQYLKNSQPEVIPFLQNMAKEALRKKKSTFAKNPTESLKKQVEILENAVNTISN